MIHLNILLGDTIPMTNQLPNQHDLIPNLGVLDRLLMENSPPNTYSSVQRETEQLPYYLRGACFSINELETYRIKAAKALAQLPGVGPDTQYILPQEHFDPLSYALDSYLFFLRRTFDSLIPYLSRCPARISLPSSMNSLVKGVHTDKYHLDSQLEILIIDFWNALGKKVKGYRDQVNHKAIILSNCIVFNSTQGVGLKMLLPDNPEEKRPSRISYNPGVNAMGFTLESLKVTVQFVNRLVERMIVLTAGTDKDPRTRSITSITMRGAPLQISSRKVGEPVPYPVSVRQIVVDAIADL